MIVQALEFLLNEGTTDEVVCPSPEFFRVNEDGLSTEEIEAINKLEVGETFTSEPSAGGTFTVKRTS